jgi:membrane complex biogenesis BtpA family protein
MQNKLFKIFNKDRNIIIGAIHFPPLFGYKDYPGFDVALKNALADLKAFQDGGVDGVIIENNYDIPHKIFVEKETVELMEKLGREIKKQAKIPLGVSVLWNDYKSALSIAKNIGGQFIRVPVFVDSVETDYGKIYANPKDVINFRKNMEAKNIALFTDIHVKHAKILENKSIEQSAKEAIESGSDALIVTGKWTGDAPDLKELEVVRKFVGDFPILVGSGADENNIKKLFKCASGAIVSTSLKEGKEQKGEVNVKSWAQRIDKDKVRNLSWSN